MNSPATDARLHVSTSPSAPPTTTPNTEIGQPKPIVDDGTTDADETLTGDKLNGAGHDNVPWRRGGISSNVGATEFATA